MKSKIEFFPRDKEIRLIDAYFYLLIFGTFGVHQFYMGNRRKGFYFLYTCGFSHLLVILTPSIFPALYLNFGQTIALVVVFSGYLLGAPVWVWDFFMLPMQVRRKKGSMSVM